MTVSNTRNGKPTEHKILIEFISLLLILFLIACDAQTPSTPVANSTGDSGEQVSFAGTDKGLRDRLQFAAKRTNETTDVSGRIALIAFDFSAHDTKGALVSRFDKPVHVSIKYGGLILSALKDSDLTIVYFNPDRRMWEDVASTVDSSAKTVSAELDHFSGYGVSGKGAKSAATIAANVTPIGGAGVVVVKYDVTTLLNTFNRVVYGQTAWTLTETGAAAVGMIASATFPANDKNILNAKVAAAGMAAYGKMSNGLEVVMAGMAGVITNDAAADIAAGGMGEVSLTGFTAPTNQIEAQKLVNQVAPSLAGINWTVKSAANGAYVFYASGQRPISTSKGTVNTTVGALATITLATNGKALVSVLVGTGALANLVK